MEDFHFLVCRNCRASPPSLAPLGLPDHDEYSPAVNCLAWPVWLISSPLMDSSMNPLEPDSALLDGQRFSISPPAGLRRSSIEESPVSQDSSALYKTELCKSFSDSGFCRYSSKCRFAHGAVELRPVKRPIKYKTEICKNWSLQRICPYNARCRFIHQEANGAAFSSSSSLGSPPPPPEGWENPFQRAFSSPASVPGHRNSGPFASISNHLINNTGVLPPNNSSPLGQNFSSLEPMNHTAPLTAAHQRIPSAGSFSGSQSRSFSASNSARSSIIENFSGISSFQGFSSTFPGGPPQFSVGPVAPVGRFSPSPPLNTHFHPNSSLDRRHSSDSVLLDYSSSSSSSMAKHRVTGGGSFSGAFGLPGQRQPPLLHHSSSSHSHHQTHASSGSLSVSVSESETGEILDEESLEHSLNVQSILHSLDEPSPRPALGRNGSGGSANQRNSLTSPPSLNSTHSPILSGSSSLWDSTGLPAGAFNNPSRSPILSNLQQNRSSAISFEAPGGRLGDFEDFSLAPSGPTENPQESPAFLGAVQ